VTVRGFTGRRQRSMAGAPRVGMFGVIGTSNIGNEGMLEAVLTWLSVDHPDAIVDFMCTGPERIKARYGAPAIPLNWYKKYQERTSGLSAMVLRTLGKGIDVFRTASWVRKHDVVIVPGAGVLEATLPVRPWLYPYTMFLLSASGRVFGTKVALVSVGASVLSQRMTKWLFTSTARLAFYRSYRDTGSYNAMRRAGIDVTRDRVYPDLAFALPVPSVSPGDPLTVGVGVMAYYGTNDDRRHADDIHAAYMEKMKRFVRWLADSGHKIRLFGGDNLWDDSVIEEILADLRAHRPDLEPMWAVAEPVTSLEELMQEMAPVGTVVAIRYHNVLCALKLSKPTLSISYAGKHDLLMKDMGLSEFCQFANTLDVDRLIEQFTELKSRSAQLTRMMAERNAEKAQLLDQQFAGLSALLFPAGEQARLTTGRSAMAAVPADGSILEHEH
jgi:polysaccharide pyruvyl transferase WcaK-like protein